MHVNASVFKAYDIRGIVGKTIDAEFAEQLGRAFGSEALAAGERAVVVGRDGRLSGPALSAALIRGLAATGLDVVDLGPVTTPMLYYVAATRAAHGCISGIQVTGSHNPKDYNGFKMVLAGRAIHGEDDPAPAPAHRGRRLRRAARAARRRWTCVAEYCARIAGDCKLARPMKIAVDSRQRHRRRLGTGVLRALGCTVIELYSEVDGDFPNHHPDPSKPENLAELIRAVQHSDAELGLAFDGDGDRLGVVTKDGQIIYPDRQLMLFARDVLTRKQGATILFDVKCSQQLAPLIRAAGGKPLMWKTGHSLMKAKMKEIGAPLAGEMSGHIFFGERWYGFDDATYTGARLLEILQRERRPERGAERPADELHHARAQRRLRRRRAGQGGGPPARRGDLPGRARGGHNRRRRVEYDDGFGLVRASNTTPVLVLRFEGTTPRGAGAHPGRLHGRPARRQARRAGRGGRALNDGARVRPALPLAGPLRVLIVKLSSLGDVVHALPVVADLRAAYPRIAIDWVVEPAFAPLLQRVAAIAEIIECPLRRWTQAGLWRPSVGRELRAFAGRLRRERYDAILDLQGLTKSAVIARLGRGRSYGLANRTDGASHEAPARWLVSKAIRIEPHVHALDRSRELVAAALGTRIDTPPQYGLQAIGSAGAAGERPRTVVLIHGTSRADKLWPEAHWIELGLRLADEGWAVALPQAGSDEGKRARAIAAAIGGDCTVWPPLELGAFIDRLAGSGGAIGVDSGPSHIAVALGLPHVQLYNFPTAWRTGPQPRHGAGLQVAVEGDPVPTVSAVWAAWKGVQSAARVAAVRTSRAT